MTEAEAVRLLSAAASLLGLGLVMGFSPTLYGVVLHLLTRSHHPSRDIRWLTAGVALGATVLLIVFRAFDPDTLTAALRGHVEEILVRRGVDLAVGAVFLLLAGIVFARMRRPRRPAAPARVPEGDHPWRMLLVGVANTVIGVSGLATMYVTGRVITGATHDTVLRLLLYAVFLTTLAGPYLVAAWAWGAFPTLARRITGAYAWAVGRDLRPALAVGLLTTGVVFLGLGVWGHGTSST